VFAPAELIGALNGAQVEFIVIGGFAVAAHGFPRATKDVDIVPSPEAENLARLAAVLRDLEAIVDGLGDFDADEFPYDPHDPEALREGGNFVLQTRLGRLDIMQWVPGIEPDLAYEHLQISAVDTSFGGHPIRVCSRDDLITMKQTAGRPQDLEDLRRLGEADELA
jgi:hypothetical protein